MDLVCDEADKAEISPKSTRTVSLNECARECAVYSENDHCVVLSDMCYTCVPLCFFSYYIECIGTRFVCAHLWNCFWQSFERWVVVIVRCRTVFVKYILFIECSVLCVCVPCIRKKSTQHISTPYMTSFRVIWLFGSLGFFLSSLFVGVCTPQT